MQHPAGAGAPRLWRQFSDEAYAGLIREWLGDAPCARVLKTDLFDEAMTAGLVGDLANLSDDVHGIDVSADVVTAARKRYPRLTARQADVRDLPYPDASFNLVVSNSTLDHFTSRTDIERSVREIRRVLRPGGRLLITLDNPVNPVVAVRQLLPYRLFSKLGIVPYYNGATLGPIGLRRCLSAHDLAVERTASFMHVPRLPAVWICRWLQERSHEGRARRWTSRFMRMERLDRWPTRYLTGYYVAALARG